ncbi:MAG: hypothetical protein RSC95_05335 [Anaerovoracaceae bacterium]
MSLMESIKNRKTRWNKRGVYIVEAVIIMPIFIMAVTALVSMIPIIGSAENVVFTVADELHLADAKAHFAEIQLSFPFKVKNRILEENSNISSFRVKDYRYKYSDRGIDDLISAETITVFHEKNPVSLFDKVEFSTKILSRGFTGTTRTVPITEETEFKEINEYEPVYIFPNWGKRYHGKNCTYIVANCRLHLLSYKLKKDYDYCEVCNSKEAGIGSPVFCFENSGKVYHLGNCKTIKKYYIEIDREDAIERGYSPCTKCGGG